VTARARPRHVAAIDVGTSGARAVAFDLAGNMAGEVRRPYPMAVPHPGWAEEDPRDWISAAGIALARLVARTGPVEAIGLTGMCPTIAPFDARMLPIGPGMLYRDNRAISEALEMRQALPAGEWHRRTGQVPEPFYAGPKVLWLRRHDPELFSRTAVFLQPRDTVLHALTGEVRTDETHANCTLFFNLRQRAWDAELFSLFDLDPALFPRALPATAVVGGLTPRKAAELRLPAGTPVVVGGADSLCLMFGAGVVGPGPVSENAGSSATVNSAVDAPLSDVRVTNYSHVYGPLFATELGLNTAGAAVTWALTALGYASFEELIADASGFRRRLQRRGFHVPAADVAPLFFPYLADGERDNPSARAAFVGLSDRHDRSALAFAVVESIALSLATLVEVLRHAGSPVDELRVAGGGTRNALLGQLKADCLDVPVRHLDVDAAALGTAMLAAMAAGMADEAQAAISAALSRARHFEPSPAGRAFEHERRLTFNRLRRSVAVAGSRGQPARA
jgi:sugar (pentulose or hexulose) kinase